MALVWTGTSVGSTVSGTGSDNAEAPRRRCPRRPCSAIASRCRAVICSTRTVSKIHPADGEFAGQQLSVAGMLGRVHRLEMPGRGGWQGAGVPGCHRQWRRLGNGVCHVSYPFLRSIPLMARTSSSTSRSPSAPHPLRTALRAPGADRAWINSAYRFALPEFETTRSSQTSELGRIR